MCLKRSAKFLLESAQEHSVLAEFCAFFQPEGVGAQMRRVYSATIGLLIESHGIVPHHLKVPQTNFFLHVNNLINLSNCKKEIRHPRLFLSHIDDLVFCRTGFAQPANKFHPTYTEGQPFALFPFLHQHFA